MPAAVDSKKGWCSMCRMGEHDLCVRDQHGGVCACKAHKASPRPEPVRPVAATVEPPANGQKAAPAPKAVLAWEEPPAVGRRAPLPPDVQAELRANPGRWAKVRIYKSGSGAGHAAKSIRAGKNGLTAREWEACGIPTTGGSALYARFVGRGGA